MPITSTVNVSKEIMSLKFNNNDTLEVVLVASQDGEAVGTEIHNFGPETVAALLDVQPSTGFTMRQAIIYSIYLKLLESGKVVGTIG